MAPRLRGFFFSGRHTESPVGASMLAKNAQATQAFRQPTSSLTTIASMLAPTGGSAVHETCGLARQRWRPHSRPGSLQLYPIPVGASMLAKNAQMMRGVRQPASSLTTIASKLAPTGGDAVHETCGLARQRWRLHSRPGSLQLYPIPVGASMLAKNAQTMRGVRRPASSLTTIASKLAPTGEWGCSAITTGAREPSLRNV